MSQTTLYRYERCYTSDGNGNTISKTVELVQHKVLEETPNGYWIFFYGRKRFRKWVSKSGKSRYAYPDKDQAWVNFQKRSEKALMITKQQFENANFFAKCQQPI